MLRQLTVPVTLSMLTALALAGLGCTQKGSMQAVETAGSDVGAPVVMRWSSPEGERVTGTLTATLPSGETFRGPYIQVADGVSNQDLEPYWTGWSGSQWGTWPQDWSPMTTATFQMKYADRVIANMKGDQGGKMRCRFLLDDSDAGLAGGGKGECQTGDGAVVVATFHSQSD